MAMFSYIAVTENHGDRRRTRGTITAESPRQARDLLRNRGLKVRTLVSTARTTAGRRAVSSIVAGERQGLFRRRRYQTQLVAFVSELATLLGAGIPLLQAIDAIARQHRGGFRLTLLQLREQVAAGASLADAMRSQPRVFDELCVSMVAVGEQSGRLDAVLEELASFKHRAQQLAGRVGTALIYPAIVLMTALAVMLFLMTFVVPQLIGALLEAGQTLPWPTRVVHAVSQWLVHYGWVLLLVAASAGIVVARSYRIPSIRIRCHHNMLKLPGVRKQAIVRIAFILSILLHSGVTFLQALRIAENATPNLALREALRRCEQAVATGRDIAPALKHTGAFPDTVVQVFAVGQQSGRLDAMLDRLAQDYDRQVQAATQRLLAMLEPAMILLLAVVIGVIVLSVILPYLEAGNVL